MPTNSSKDKSGWFPWGQILTNIITISLSYEVKWSASPKAATQLPAQAINLFSLPTFLSSSVQALTRLWFQTVTGSGNEMSQYSHVHLWSENASVVCVELTEGLFCVRAVESYKETVLNNILSGLWREHCLFSLWWILSQNQMLCGDIVTLTLMYLFYI